MVTETGEKETRVGYVSKSFAIWVSKRVSEAVLMAVMGKLVRLFQKIWGFGSYMHVYVRVNGRGRFLKIKLQSYENACVDVYLKVPEEEKFSGWRSFA